MVQVYTKEEQAIRFVVKVLDNQTLKNENLHLAFHSVSVGFMLKNLGCNEDVVISGILHSILQNTEYTYDDVAEYFGKKIAKNILIIQEDNTIKDFKQRKMEWLKKIKKQSKDILLIILADHLHYLITLYEIWKEKKENTFGNLAKDYNEQKWYFLELEQLLTSQLEENNLLLRYQKICEIYFK